MHKTCMHACSVCVILLNTSNDGFSTSLCACAYIHPHHQKCCMTLNSQKTRSYSCMRLMKWNCCIIFSTINCSHRWLCVLFVCVCVETLVITQNNHIMLLQPQKFGIECVTKEQLNIMENLEHFMWFFASFRQFIVQCAALMLRTASLRICWKC